jgi:hypothetical protein
MPRWNASIVRRGASLLIAAALAGSAFGEDAKLATVSAELGLSGSYALSGYSDGTYSIPIPGYPDFARPLSMSPWFYADIDAKYFQIIGKLSANTDGKYAPALFGSGEFFGTYFMLDEGGFKSTLGPVSLEAGRFRHFDTVDTPYSLFINGRGLAAPILDIDYDDGHFFYESRWIGLNSGSTMATPAWPSGFPDRGANVKNFGFHIGDMRIGFQDLAVYCNEVFDPAYFFLPIPMYFTQYFRGTGGRPWTDGLSFLAQILIDDLTSTGSFPAPSGTPGWRVSA